MLGVFPSLEAALDLVDKGALLTVGRVTMPRAARRLGEARLARWLKTKGVRKSDAIAGRVIAAAKVQRHELPAAEAKAALVAEIASEILKGKERLAALDARLGELVEANPRGEVIRSLPGMGTTLTAEFLAEVVGDVERFGSADDLAAAAGIAPVLRSSGNVCYQRTARKGNRVLKRVFHQSAHCAILHHEQSKAFYRRKRSEGKGHNRAVIALARRRVNVLWAMLRDGLLYQEQTPRAA